jgi:putative redox protein
VDVNIPSGDLSLDGYLAHPRRPGRAPGVVLCHGLPRSPRGATTSAVTYPELADRIARDTGWIALACNLRGTGRSNGDFSVDGWLEDLHAAVAMLAASDDVAGVWVAGIGEGGTLAICAAADDDRIHGVATLGAPVWLRDWGRDAGRLLAHARRTGMIRTGGFPSDPAAWGRAVYALDALAAAPRLAPRSLLVLHGSVDDVVPPAAARALYEAAGDGAELRVIHAAGYRLRHDPRAVAVLLGWLDRQRP